MVQRASFIDMNFHHPFTPYDVQEEFMRTVYNVLAQGAGQIGILESPTGTVRHRSRLTACLSCLCYVRVQNRYSSCAEVGLD